MPINDYLNLISNSIEKFSINNFKNFTLRHNVDYVICLTLLNTDIKGQIKCGCNTIIKISFRPHTNSFQLSAYFKHLKNSRCSVIKKRKLLLSENLEKINNSSNDSLRSNNFQGTNNDIHSDEEVLNDDDDDHDSSQRAINSLISNKSNGFSKKRSTSSTNIHKKKCIAECS